jgi:hypothetical protein
MAQKLTAGECPRGSWEGSAGARPAVCARGMSMHAGKPIQVSCNQFRWVPSFPHRVSAILIGFQNFHIRHFPERLCRECGR